MLDRVASQGRFVNNIGERNLKGDQYFEQVKRNFAAFKKHIVKKNETLRQSNARKEHAVSPNKLNSDKKPGLAGLIKESQDEIMELSQPFKVIFETAITDVSLTANSLLTWKFCADQGGNCAKKRQDPGRGGSQFAEEVGLRFRRQLTDQIASDEQNCGTESGRRPKNHI